MFDESDEKLRQEFTNEANAIATRFMSEGDDMSSGQALTELHNIDGVAPQQVKHWLKHISYEARDKKNRARRKAEANPNDDKLGAIAEADTTRWAGLSVLNGRLKTLYGILEELDNFDLDDELIALLRS